MNVTSIRSNSPSRWPLIAILILVGLTSLYFIRSNVLHYLSSDPAAFGTDFWPRRFGLWPHLAGGAIALAAGIAQLWLGFTGRTGALHRRLGRLYLCGVVIGCAGGYYLSLTTVSPPGFTYRSGLFFLTVAWTLTTAVACVAIRARQFDLHREWMIRSYVLTFAFVTFRLSGKLIDAWGIAPDDEAQRMLSWFCWSVPLLITVVVQDLRRLRRVR